MTTKMLKTIVTSKPLLTFMNSSHQVKFTKSNNKQMISKYSHKLSAVATEPPEDLFILIGNLIRLPPVT